MNKPILKPNSSWFTPTVNTNKRALITLINIVDTYTLTGSETDSWDASVAQDGSIMCYIIDTELTIAGNGSGGIQLSPDASWTFSDINTSDYFSVLTAINGANLLDLSNVTTALRFFNKCVKLQSVDVSQFDMSSCTDTSYMFNSCTMLEIIDVANWDVSKVQTMRCMFQTAQKANQGNGAVQILDVSKWNTSSCTNMSYMFYGCGNITELDVSNFDVSNVTEFNHTFCDNYKLQGLNIRNWDVSKVNTFNAMFNDCLAFTTIDFTGWNTSNVIAFSQMFEGCENLEKIIGLETWDTSSGKNFGEMFRYCYALKELDLSSFDTRNATTTYQHPSAEKGLNQFFGPEARALEKVTFGPNFTFLGDGGCVNGYLPVPSENYFQGTDGNWYTLEGVAYTPTAIPNNTYATYYATKTLAQSHKYVSYNSLVHYNSKLNDKFTAVTTTANEYANTKVAELAATVAYIDIEDNSTIITEEVVIQTLEEIANGKY